jgi:outer membrane protein OmpA-like peptidoglycan-associated protein
MNAMNIRYGLAATALVAAMSGGQALAAGFLNTDSAYVGIGGGAVFLQDQDLGAGFKLNPDTGWMVDGTLGVRWSSGWRVELEGAYRDNDYKFLIARGDIEGYSVIVNAIRDFDLGWKVKPYLGFGAGALFANYNIEIPGTGLAADDDSTQGVWQAIAGITVPIAPRFEGFVDYRYLETFEKIRSVDDRYAAHEVTAGVRYTFWQAAAPVVAAPPPPPPATKDYVVYFEFNKSNITPAAGAVLDELKSTVGGKPVSVVGHTDTVGSMKYNQGLSEKRAHSTGKALVTRGVKVESETGRSFSEPAVNTGPGVKEPLNRRAVIKVDSGAGM